MYKPYQLLVLFIIIYNHFHLSLLHSGPRSNQKMCLFCPHYHPLLRMLALYHAQLLQMYCLLPAPRLFKDAVDLSMLQFI